MDRTIRVFSNNSSFYFEGIHRLWRVWFVFRFVSTVKISIYIWSCFFLHQIVFFCFNFKLCAISLVFFVDLCNCCKCSPQFLIHCWNFCWLFLYFSKCWFYVSSFNSNTYIFYQNIMLFLHVDLIAKYLTSHKIDDHIARFSIKSFFEWNLFKKHPNSIFIPYRSLIKCSIQNKSFFK